MRNNSKELFAKGAQENSLAQFKYEKNLKLLALGGFLILGSAAVVTALYLPEHMPTVIENIVNKLIPTYFYMILGGSVLGAGAGLGCLYYGRQKKTLNLELDDEFSDRLDNESIDGFHNETNGAHVGKKVVSQYSTPGQGLFDNRKGHVDQQKPTDLEMSLSDDNEYTTNV
jgi:hypothetical protein